MITQVAGETELYILVEKFGGDAPAPGQATVQLRIDVGPDNDTVENAAQLEAERTVTGTTLVAEGDYEVAGGCVVGNDTVAPGRDVVYGFEAPVDGGYTFTVKVPPGSFDAVLYVVDELLEPGMACSGADRTEGRAETASTETLAEGDRRYVVVDAGDATSPGGPFTLEAYRTVDTEAEPNGTPGTANPLPQCGSLNAVVPTGDVDFFELGGVTNGDEIFAMIDSSSSSSTDPDLRVTSATDTLEYDDTDADEAFGAFGPVIAGRAGDASGSTYLRVSGFDDAASVDPYRLVTAVHPGMPDDEAEPNQTADEATDAGRYAEGALSDASDVDVYAFTAVAGQLVFVALDGDPLRDNTPMNAAIELRAGDGALLARADDGNTLSDTGSGAGSLEAVTPTSPAEGVLYRVSATGSYYVHVRAGDGPAGAGDYELSIAPDCTTGRGPEITLAALPDGRVAAGNMIERPSPRPRAGRRLQLRHRRRHPARRPRARGRRSHPRPADDGGHRDLHGPGDRRERLRRQREYTLDVAAARARAGQRRAGRRRGAHRATPAALLAGERHQRHDDQRRGPLLRDQPQPRRLVPVHAARRRPVPPHHSIRGRADGHHAPRHGAVRVHVGQARPGRSPSCRPAGARTAATTRTVTVDNQSTIYTDLTGGNPYWIEIQNTRRAPPPGQDSVQLRIGRRAAAA